MGKIERMRKKLEMDVLVSEVHRENRRKKADIELKDLETEMELEPKRAKTDEMKAQLAGKRAKTDEMKAQLAGKRALKNASGIFFAIMCLLYATSAALSVAGLSGIGSLVEIGSSYAGKFGVASLLFTIIQTSMSVFGYYAYTLKAEFYNEYKGLRTVQNVIMLSSIYCNYQYIQGQVGATTPGNAIVCGALAAACDIVALYFSRIANNIKYCNYSHADQLQAGGWLHKIWIALFGGVMVSIQRKYLANATRLQDALNGKFDGEEPATIPAEQTETKTEVNHDEQRARGIDYFLEIVKNYPNGAKITKADLGLENDIVLWTKVREELRKMGYVECRDKATFRTDKVA